MALELAEADGRHRSERALLRHCRRIISLGIAAAREERKKTVTFRTAAESLLAQRSRRRPRTVAEIAGICRRLMREHPTLPQRRLRSMQRADCARLLAGFGTPRQRRKARAILHGLFAHAVRNGWCDTNPVATLPQESVEEAEIHPLTAAELRRLLHTAQHPAHRDCMPALGLMLWAGVRPAEITRLTWADINQAEGIITLHPRQSKTGGCRHITLYPVLQRWLQRCGCHREGPLCPPNWLRRWRALRRRAGLLPWRQDVLRHTYASYHAKRFRHFPMLQAEMGHRSAELLRTRYLNLQGITAATAEAFWNGTLCD